MRLSRRVAIDQNAMRTYWTVGLYGRPIGYARHLSENGPLFRGDLRRDPQEDRDPLVWIRCEVGMIDSDGFDFC